MLSLRFLAASTLFLLLSPALGQDIPPLPTIAAQQYLLVDFQSGHTVAQKNSTQRIAPASLTKLMTAYIVYQSLRDQLIRIDEQVTVSHKAWRTPGSRMFIEVGKQVSVNDLLRGVVIHSGNDASVALAEHIAGQESAFAVLMNQQAEKLGMRNSHFKNSNGLPDPEHYSSLQDLGRLTGALIKDFPQHYRMYSERSFRFNNITQANRNRLLWFDDSVDGVKTGYTEAAGYCLVASAKRNGMRLISLVAGSPSSKQRNKDSASLLQYGFRFFTNLSIAQPDMTSSPVWGGTKEEVPVALLAPIHIVLQKSNRPLLEIRQSFSQPLHAPIAQGQTIGELAVWLGQERLASQTLIASDTVERAAWWKRGWDNLRRRWQQN